MDEEGSILGCTTESWFLFQLARQHGREGQMGEGQGQRVQYICYSERIVFVCLTRQAHTTDASNRSALEIAGAENYVHHEEDWQKLNTKPQLE